MDGHSQLTGNLFWNHSSLNSSAGSGKVPLHIPPAALQSHRLHSAFGSTPPEPLPRPTAFYTGSYPDSKVFFRYFYVNTITGEKSGEVLLDGKFA